VGYFQHGLIQILLASDLITDYNISVSNLSGNWINLKLTNPTDEYQAQWQSEGDSKIKTTFNGTYPVASPQIYSFTIDLLDPYLNIRLAVEEQAQRCASTLSTGTVSNLQVRDYCNPEHADLKTAIANNTRPFTLRQCQAYKTDSQVYGNLVSRSPTRLIGKGWSMTFHDVNLKFP
jgi:hypothetical protein